MHLASTFLLISTRKKSLFPVHMEFAFCELEEVGDGREEEDGKDVFSSEATDVNYWSKENVKCSFSLRH